MPIPPHWETNQDKPICRECGCVEFSEDMICEACNEPLVVKPFKKVKVLQLIAADKWGKHWPEDYIYRCFVCGWKTRKALFSIIPTNPEDIMAANMWATLAPAIKLAEILCPNKTLSLRMKTVMGVLSHTGENALMPISANKKFAELAEKYNKKGLSFCRQCAEADAEPKPVETVPLSPITLTESMSAAMQTAIGEPQQKVISKPCTWENPPSIAIPKSQKKTFLQTLFGRSIPKQQKVEEIPDEWETKEDDWDEKERESEENESEWKDEWGGWETEEDQEWEEER